MKLLFLPLECVVGLIIICSSALSAEPVPQQNIEVNFSTATPQTSVPTAPTAPGELPDQVEAEPEEDTKEEEVDPSLRPLQYFKDEFVRSCMGAQWLKDVQLSGFIDQSYTYNFNHPKDRKNGLRVYDRKDRAYLLNMLQIYAVKDPTKDSRWGFASRLSSGWDANVNSSFDENNDDKLDVQEFYGSYLFDIGENGLLVKAGKMATLAGAEVIEEKDNWNISRSFLYGYAIPLTHTGVRANYQINDIYDFTFGINRGWDTFRHDNNDSYSYEARLGAAVNDKLNLGATVIAGPEQGDNDHDNRRLLDLVATYKFNDKLTGMLNADIADEKNAANDGGKAKWQGLAAYLKYECNDKLSFAWRGEAFQDKGGSRTGDKQNLWENTVTTQYNFRENLIGRLEYRYDHSNKDAFTDSSGLDSNQSTIAASVMITF